MSMNDIPALKVGTASQSNVFAPLLGQVISYQDNVYRLAKVSGAITTCAGKAVLSARNTTTFKPSWVVSAITTANDVTVAGIIPSTQVGSDGSTGLLDGDYFWLLEKGYDTALVPSASGIAIGTAFGTGTGSTLLAYTGADPMVRIVAFAVVSGAAQTGGAGGSQLGVQLVLND